MFQSPSLFPFHCWLMFGLPCTTLLSVAGFSSSSPVSLLVGNCSSLFTTRFTVGLVLHRQHPFHCWRYTPSMGPGPHILNIPDILARTNTPRSITAGLSRMFNTLGQAGGKEHSLLLRNNSLTTGNRLKTARKPATESSVVQGSPNINQQ